MAGKAQKGNAGKSRSKKLPVRKETAKDLSVKNSGKVKGGGIGKERACSATGETYT